jgi:hypothetical protein
MSMTNMNAKQFGEICDRIWTDRASVLRGSGQLSAEATLVRAVFWRLCKAGLKTKGCAENDGSKPAILAYQTIVCRMLEMHGRPAFDCAPILQGLIERCKNEEVSK